MCGIIGVLQSQNSKISPELSKQLTDSLFKLSESRGKEAAGISIKTKQNIYTFKQAIPATRLIKSKQYQENFKEATADNPPLSIIGHSRLVTDGLQTNNDNNQPVIKSDDVIVHNGIIVNTKPLWNYFSDLKRDYDVDTEIILSLIQKNLQENRSIDSAVSKTFNLLEGAASIAVLIKELPKLIIATNTGSIYTCTGINNDIFIFASEKYILKELASNKFKGILNADSIKQVKAGLGQIIDLNDLQITKFQFQDHVNQGALEEIKEKRFTVTEEIVSTINNNENLLKYNENLDLKRCTRCILPETFPGIKFDSNGACNICNNFKKKPLLSLEKLKQEVAPYRNKSCRPDVLVAFSGGRDSAYGLHYIKKVLKMNPIAYTYDWGMVTDLARRNQARICGKLGIEHIIVSADIKKKREYIRKNVSAWLKRPNLGTVPLFMAGDKQFFYYANRLMKQNDIDLMIFCENSRLEKTSFKTGFCGVDEGNKRWVDMTTTQKAKLATYYAKEFIKNPAYINASLFDTLFAFFSTYLMKHDYVFLYKYIDWDEEKIISTLIDGYNWETSLDTKSTWRIGDGTAPFYNYIYHTLAGFTENDTFRSNQIREGMITREQALNFIKDDNRPRYDSFKWYTDQISIDTVKAINIINSAPKIYQN
ncbi:hypothetical protein KKA15_01005 [Patescibacteria group bacterium]|nr:hypothetical protein [Patescibacteria group bacterium]